MIRFHRASDGAIGISGHSSTAFYLPCGSFWTKARATSNAQIAQCLLGLGQYVGHNLFCRPYPVNHGQPLPRPHGQLFNFADGVRPRCSGLIAHNFTLAVQFHPRKKEITGTPASKHAERLSLRGNAWFRFTANIPLSQFLIAPILVFSVSRSGCHTGMIPSSPALQTTPHQFGLDRASHGRKNNGIAHTHRITKAIGDALSVSCFDQCEHAWVFIRRNAICMTRRKKAPENRGFFIQNISICA